MMESSGASVSGGGRPTMRIIQILAAVMIVAGSGAAMAQQTQKYRAMLLPTPIETAHEVVGKAVVMAELSGRRLTITGTFTGLGSPATRADVHVGPILGVTGPVVFPLTVSKGVSGTISGSGDLSSSQVTALAANKLYVEIDSESAPDGNSRGWLFIAEGQ